jgi:DNA-binding XRE family transcriptional regulator
MNAHIDFQTIMGRDGRPEYFVVPAQVFERIRPLLEVEILKNGIPQAVVEAHVLHDVPMVRAWREHLGLTQQEVCERAGLQQPALARMESAGVKLHKATRKKLAAAMGITLEQLA